MSKLPACTNYTALRRCKLSVAKQQKGDPSAVPGAEQCRSSSRPASRICILFPLAVRKARMRDTHAFRRHIGLFGNASGEESLRACAPCGTLSWRPQTQPRGTHTQAEKKDEDRQLLSQPRNGSRRTTLKPASASCHFLFTGPARPGPMLHGRWLCGGGSRWPSFFFSSLWLRNRGACKGCAARGDR